MMKRSPGSSGCLSHGVPCLRTTGFPSRCHQLAQHLSSDFRARHSELAHGRAQRAPQRRWYGETGKSMLESLKTTSMSAVAGGRVLQQVLGNPQGEPQGEDSLPAWPSACLRQESE